ncbi:restriction endonuclease subunit S [Labrys sedimenti]|uniref:restriction endonuclease subunit S n=1 Tax=Labrys sedimenti TaxID=3106036 RepID=UPI002ACAFE43|nr:restriction endonuclease subunit S [Labrys sp. ZIDIC5]MDZ5448268.1 restriction endonuclease subunit S [Labrys sp. ZIDIC5]
MVGEWREVTLADVSADITVGHVGLMADQYVTDGVPFLRSLNVEPFSIKTDDLKYITRNFHSRLGKSALKPGDVVIVRTGKPGACSVVPDWLTEANCSDLVIVRLGEQVRPSFLSYVVNSTARHHIDSHTVGAVQQHFNVGSARTLRFMLPPLIEQDRIIGLLDAVRDKIELNQRMASTLEAMAHALFRSWFVDFDPVYAKAENRATSLPDELAALFPDRFDGSHLPSGWQRIPISDAFDLVGGGTPKTSVPEYWHGSVPWFSVVDAPAESAPFVLATERNITQLGLDNCASALLPTGATIVSARGTVGRLAIVGVPMAMNQSCYAAIAKEGYSNYFVYYLLRHTLEELKARSHGSVFSTITRQTFASVHSTIPDKKAIVAFDRAVTPLMGRIKAQLQQSRTLVVLRDTLLPKLISGELRIADAEAQVSAA